MMKLIHLEIERRRHVSREQRIYEGLPAVLWVAESGLFCVVGFLFFVEHGEYSIPRQWR